MHQVALVSFAAEVHEGADVIDREFEVFNSLGQFVKRHAPAVSIQIAKKVGQSALFYDHIGPRNLSGIAGTCHNEYKLRPDPASNPITLTNTTTEHLPRPRVLLRPALDSLMIKPWNLGRAGNLHYDPFGGMTRLR